MRSTSHGDLTARWRTIVGPRSSKAASGKRFWRRRKCGHGEHVELEAEAPRAGRRSAAPIWPGRSRRPGSSTMRFKRRLEPRPGGELAHEQRGLARRRHVQVRRLDGAAVVVEVGVLDDERGVEPGARQHGLQAAEAGPDLRRGHQRGARLDERRPPSPLEASAPVGVTRRTWSRATR